MTIGPASRRSGNVKPALRLGSPLTWGQLQTQMRTHCSDMSPCSRHADMTCLLTRVRAPPARPRTHRPAVAKLEASGGMLTGCAEAVPGTSGPPWSLCAALLGTVERERRLAQHA